MKIIFVTDTLSSGGSERVISVLANNLSGKHDVEIVCLRGISSFYYLNEKVNVLYLQRTCGGGWHKKFHWLRRNIPEGSIVVAFMVPVYIFVLVALLFRHVPVIVSERNDPHSAALSRRILRRLLIPRAQAIVVQTQEIKKYFPKPLWRRIRIIYNPISSRYVWQSGLRAKKENVIINIGRLSRQKNHRMLIDAFAIVSARHPEYQLHIYGEGEIHKEIESYIDERGLVGKVILKGRCDNLENVLPHAKIFALSSDYEGMSNALVEAMYIGIPVVTTAVSGTEELIENGKNGIVVPIGKANEFAVAVNRLIENKMQVDAIAIAGTKVKAKVEPSVIVGAWEQLIVSVYAHWYNH